MSWQQMGSRRAQQGTSGNDLVMADYQDILSEREKATFPSSQRWFVGPRPFFPGRLLGGIISLLLWLAGLAFVLSVSFAAPAYTVMSDGEASSAIWTEPTSGQPVLFLVLLAAFLAYSAILLLINVLLWKRH